MRSIAGELEFAAEAEGNEPGSPGFRLALLRLSIERCAPLQGVARCTDCPAQLGCTILARYREAGGRRGAP